MIDNTILVIGGANMEYILKSKKDIVQGSKNFVDIEELFGGSGVNYTLRLLSYGEVVYPVLFLGNDSTGMRIAEEIRHLSPAKTKDFLAAESFFVPALTTPRSTIIVEGIHRTILSQDANKNSIFQTFVAKRIAEAGAVDTVVIGHIHNDRAEINPDKKTLTTLYVLEYFSDKNTLIYANFGASQLEYGFYFWKKHLKKVDILQLNIHELRAFLADDESCDLACLIQKIRALEINMIITIDKFGALGLMKEKKNTLFMARPINDDDEFIDSTGAGDAFCAGMVSRLAGKKYFDEQDFKEAMERARSWATYACKSFGGANACPTKKVLDHFHHIHLKSNEVALYHDEAMRDIIALVDTMLQRA